MKIRLNKIFFPLIIAGCMTLEQPSQYTIGMADSSVNAKVLQIGDFPLGGAEPKLIQIASINNRKDQEVVIIQGRVKSIHANQKDNNISFVIDDGTGELNVQAFLARERLTEEHKLPAAGEEVRVIGKLMLSKKFGNSLVVKLSLKPKTELMVAVKKSDIKKARQAILKGENVNARDSNGNTPLIINARQASSEEIMRLLLKNGANVNARNYSGITALMLAARFGRTEKIDILLKHGAEINAKSNAGKTALMESAARGDVKIVNQLLEAAADVNQRTESKGETALRIAIQNGHKELADILRKAGGQE